jgi:hypothetical protein
MTKSENNNDINHTSKIGIAIKEAKARGCTFLIEYKFEIGNCVGLVGIEYRK